MEYSSSCADRLQEYLDTVVGDLPPSTTLAWCPRGTTLHIKIMKNNIKFGLPVQGECPARGGRKTGGAPASGWPGWMCL